MSGLSDYFKSREDPYKAFFDSLDFPCYISSFSALDRYFDRSCGYYLNLVTTASLVEVARYFDRLEFPGLPGLDAVVRLTGMEISPGTNHPSMSGEILLLISCQLEEEETGIPSTENASVLSLLYGPSGRRFYDSRGIYPILRGRTPPCPEHFGLDIALSWEPWLDAAIMVSRYPSLSGLGSRDLEYSNEEKTLGFELFKTADSFTGGSFTPVDPFRQREVLIRILEGKNPARGLELLRRCGFIRSHWPELQRMIRVRQGKEHHPEGDVWDHSLATFSYRKNTDLAVSLALLLHDSGKPEAREAEGHKFHRHAQLGGRIAARFLKRLGFSSDLVDQVLYLVNNHMVPGITRSLPPFRVREVISSPLYPLLLEVYRCDLSSTYRGPEGYYEACEVYRRYLKHARNPFRDSGGRKRFRLYVEN